MSTLRRTPRLAFYRPALAASTPESVVPFQTGVPSSNGSTLREHLEISDLVGNNGNMIHRMAMVQMLDFDRNSSAQLNIFLLIEKLQDQTAAAKLVSQHYDGFVITLSNALRENSTEFGLADFLRALTIPIWCVGLGIQDEIADGEISSLPFELLEMLQVLNEKALLFGVRGKRTEKWLRSVGLHRAKAIGCPSMFAYPRNILSIRSPYTIDKIITGGYLALNRISVNKGRKLLNGLKGIGSAGYVFQGELNQFTELMDVPHVYDEATQSLDATVISDYIEERCGLVPPFSSYYSFVDVAAWRQVCRSYDAFIGDRMHGSVAAMQVGKPALVLYSDARVKELVDFHGIPSCDLDEFSALGWRDMAAKYLSVESIKDFHAIYSESLANFELALSDSGLSLRNRL